MPFPDKDLSEDKHHAVLRNTVRPSPGQKHEKQFFKTDISCTRHSDGFDATCASRGS
jgi:hypothetical protein